MGMSGDLQAKLSPISPPNAVEFNQVAVKKPEKAADMGEVAPDLDFRSMLQNSNLEVSRERSAKKSGDLSAAKTDDDFYRMLNERNNPNRTPKNQLGKDDFMKLFIAQMQNQDPLNPSDSTQMAAQMAQFNGLEQMMNVNNTLTAMLKAQDQGRTVQMINYVGKEVDVGNGMLKFDKNKMTKATFHIDQPVAGATLEVRDGSGQVISQDDLGSLMPGEHNVKWQGKLKDGQPASPGIYNFQIVGKSVEGQDMAIPIKSKIKITGIDLKEEGGAFFTELGKIQMKDVTSVGVQGFDEQKAPTVVKGMGTSTKDDKQSGKGFTDNLQAPLENGAIEKGVDAQALANPAAPALPPGLMEMAQRMVNKEENSGTNSPGQDKVNPINPSSGPNPDGIKVQVASSGE